MSTTILPVLRFCGIALLTVVLVLGYFATIRPIHPSTHYFKDILGNIFYDASGGCFDVCILRSYKPLAGVRRSTFMVLSVESPYFFEKEKVESEYAKDIAHVYYREQVVNTANPQTFVALGVNLGKDNLSYYLNGMPLSDYISSSFNPSFVAEPSSLTILSYKLDEYLIIKYRDAYYNVKLNPQPKELLQITSAEANLYPKL